MLNSPKPKILIIDDEIDNLEALQRLFRQDFEVVTAQSGEEGLKLFKNDTFHTVISDQRMPQMLGTEFLKQVSEINEESVRILLTGYTDVESVIEAINLGQVYKYVTKPWDPVDFVNTIKKACEKYELSRELKVKNLELKNALDELSVLDQSKTQFMYLVNHELKTPLTVLVSYLSLLKESKLDEEQTLYSGKMERAVDRLQRLIDSVLLLISAETGLMETNPQSLNLDEMVETVWGEFKADIDKKQLTLNKNLNDSKITADKTAMSRVLKELISNAVRFSEKSTIVDISVENEMFFIESEGKEISQDLIDKVMQPFALDEDMLNHSKGLGLGLSLSRALLNSLELSLEMKPSGAKTRVGFHL